MTDSAETALDGSPEWISVSVSHALIRRYAANLEARCDQQAALVADLKARGEDTHDAEALLRELERGLMLLEARRRGSEPSRRSEPDRVSAPQRREPHQP